MAKSILVPVSAISGKRVAYKKKPRVGGKTVSIKSKTPIVSHKSIKPKIGKRTRQIASTKQRLKASINTKKGVVKNSLNGGSDPRINDLRNSCAGKLLVIIGNGPSHKEAPLYKLKDLDNVEMMCVNRPDERIWPPDYWTFCDNSQYKRHLNLWERFAGTIFNTKSVKAEKTSSIKLVTKAGRGFSNNLNKGVHVGRSTVYTSMQIATWLGHDKVYIFGCDMAAVKGKLYPWGSNPDVDDQTRINRFKNESEYYSWAAENMPQRIIDKFVFCSAYNTWPFTKKFKTIDHMQAVKNIIKLSKEMSNGQEE